MARIAHDQAEHYEQNSGSEWFSLPNHGDIATVQFMLNTMEDLDVFACHRVEVNGKERNVDCLRNYDDPIEQCPFCAAGIPVKPVRLVVMMQHEDNKIKVWERGKQFISKLQSLANRYHPLCNYVFEIERNGAKGDKETKYEIFPIPDAQPIDISEVERPELTNGIIMSKTADEMNIYLDTGDFPQTADNSTDNSAQQRRQAPAQQRRGGSATTARRQVSADTAQAQPATRRRSASTPPADNTATQPSSRGSRRGAQNNDKEVF